MKGKKRVNLYVSDEAFETVKAYLESKGQSVSGWVSAMLDEMAKEIQGEPSPLSKSVEDMTVKEFGEVVSYWWQKIREVDDALDRKRG
jgi:hypothetical protein